MKLVEIADGVSVNPEFVRSVAKAEEEKTYVYIVGEGDDGLFIADHSYADTIKLLEEKKITAAGFDFFDRKNDPNRFVKLEDGWFNDEFLSEIYGKRFDRAPDSLEKRGTWQEMMDYAEQSGGFLPSTFEWESIIDRERYNPAIVEAAKLLDLKMDDWYWSRDPGKWSDGAAWSVNPERGFVGYGYKDFRNYGRPCRFRR